MRSCNSKKFVLFGPLLNILNTPDIFEIYNFRAVKLSINNTFKKMYNIS